MMNSPVEQCSARNGSTAVGEQVEECSHRADTFGDHERECERWIHVPTADVAEALNQCCHGEATGQRNHKPIGRRTEDEHGASPREMRGTQQEHIEEGG